MQPAVLFSKISSPFFSRPCVENSSGEVGGQTEGAMRALVAAGFRVVYFGRWVGPFVPKVVVVQPCTNFVGKKVPSAEEQEAGWEMDAAALEPHAPFSFALHCSGPQMSRSVVRNPKNAKTIITGVRYTAPHIAMLRRFRLRRAVALVDPLQWPLDQEMSEGWPEMRPAALIGHSTVDRSMVVGGQVYSARCVEGDTETWNYDPPAPRREKEVAAVCVAHAHLGRGTEPAWRKVLADPPAGFKVYGDGWREYVGYDPSVFLGPVQPFGAFEKLRAARCCPALAHSKMWFGTKHWLCVHNGCVPLSYGRDPEQPCCWDPREKYVPLDHWSRISEPGDLRRVAEAELCLDEMKQIFRPSYSKLLSLAEAMGQNLPEDDVWHERWGGYRP